MHSWCYVFFPAGKKGPIYNVDWNPNSEEFCVVYGCILNCIVVFIVHVTEASCFG